MVDVGMMNASVRSSGDKLMELRVAQPSVPVLVVGALEIGKSTVADWSTSLVVHGSQLIESDITRSILIVSVKERSEI